MITVVVQDLQVALAIDESTIRDWSTRALEYLDIEDTELSIVLVDDAYIQKLNKTYLDRDRPTNVISFPQQDGSDPLSNLLGDIAISVQRAIDEADQAEMLPMERVKQLLVHGICHLCGYNHEGVTEDEALRMENKEAQIVDLLRHNAE